MTTLPAVVRIVDLPTATTITGAELFEVVQTSSSVGLSVQVPVSAIMTTALGALPTGGATGSLLSKNSGTNFDASWTSVISTTLGIVGTTLVTGTFGVVGTATFTSGAFNVVGTTLVTGILNIVGTTFITGTLNQVGTSLFTANLLGVVGTATFTSGAFGVVGTALFTSGAFGVVGTTLVTGALGVVGTALVTGSVIGLSTFRALAATAAIAGGTTSGGYLISNIATFGMFCGTGVPTMSAATGSIYLRTDGTTATTRLYIATSAAGGWTGVTTQA